MIPKSDNIKPLIIGLGLAGSRHLDAQLKLGVKTGIYNRNKNITKALRENSNVIIFEDLEEGLDWCNLVHVCTPDDKHTDYIIKALKERKAVFSEKPITTNIKEALLIQDLAHKLKSILIIGNNYRLTPTFLESKKIVSRGELGTITGIEVTYLDDMDNYRFGTKWRNMQDFLYVGGSHAVDLACWIINKPVISVQAATGIKIKKEYGCGERYQIIMKFKSGVLGHVRLDSSSAQILDGSDLIIYGSEGVLVSHNKRDELLFYRKAIKKVQSIKLPNTKTLTTFEEVKIINEFLSGKINSFSPLPNIDEAVNTIKVLAVIERAVQNGKSETLD